MAVLRERVSYARPRPPNETRRSSGLTPAEQENARKAIRFLAKRYGGVARLAKAVSVKPATMELALSKRGAVSAGIALRAARAAGAPPEDVLSGNWPPAGMCPLCGRI